MHEKVRGICRRPRPARVDGDAGARPDPGAGHPGSHQPDRHAHHRHAHRLAALRVRERQERVGRLFHRPRRGAGQARHREEAQQDHQDREEGVHSAYSHSPPHLERGGSDRRDHDGHADAARQRGLLHHLFRDGRAVPRQEGEQDPRHQGHRRQAHRRPARLHQRPDHPGKGAQGAAPRVPRPARGFPGSPPGAGRRLHERRYPARRAQGQGGQSRPVGNRGRVLLLRAVRHGHAEERRGLPQRGEQRPHGWHRVRQVLRDLRQVVRPQGRAPVSDVRGRPHLHALPGRPQITPIPSPRRGGEGEKGAV